MTEADAKALAAKGNAKQPNSKLSDILKSNDAYNLGPKPDMMANLIKQEQAANTPKFTAGPDIPKPVAASPNGTMRASGIELPQPKLKGQEADGTMRGASGMEMPTQRTALQKVADSMGPGYSNVGDLGDKPTTRSSLTNFENQDKTPEVEAAADPVAVAEATAPEDRGLIGQTDSAINNNALPETKTGIGSKISDLVKKYGVGLADIIQAGAQGYTGNNAETALDKRTAESLKERENAYFAKLSAEKDALDQKRQAEAEARQFAYLTERDKSQSQLDAEGLDKQLENNIILARMRGDIPQTQAAAAPRDIDEELTSMFGGE